MNIGIFSIDHLRDWHGTTRLLDRIAVAMTQRGHSVTMIAHEGKASTKTPVSLMDYPHELITVGLQDVRSRRVANEKIKASNIDVCLASVGNNLILNMPGLLRDTGIPFVYGDPHDPRVRTFAGWQPYESYGALACADAIQTLLPEYIQYYPAPLRERVAEIGIPAPQHASVDFKARRNKTVRTIIAVGRLNETMKRFSLLLRAFAMLHSDFPDWKLKIVGDGPYWEYYRIMAQQLGIARCVDFTGAVLDPGEHYNRADIFCSSSLLEGFPLVLSEAAAYALPMVGFDFCTAYAAFITPDIGKLAKCGADGATHEALAEALRALMILTPEQRERLGLRGREVVQERYNGELLYDKWEKLLSETVENVRKASETALEWVIRMEGKTKLEKAAQSDSESTLRYIGTDWDGLGPDSPVWTGEVLDAAAAEIAAREDPFKVCESAEHNDGAESTTNTASIEAENIRLRCELVRLKEDYGRLEKKYTSLLEKVQTGHKMRRR